MKHGVDGNQCVICWDITDKCEEVLYLTQKEGMEIQAGQEHQGQDQDQEGQDQDQGQDQGQGHKTQTIWASLIIFFSLLKIF